MAYIASRAQGGGLTRGHACGRCMARTRDDRAHRGGHACGRELPEDRAGDRRERPHDDALARGGPTRSTRNLSRGAAPAGVPPARAGRAARQAGASMPTGPRVPRGEQREGLREAELVALLEDCARARSVPAVKLLLDRQARLQRAEQPEPEQPRSNPGVATLLVDLDRATSGRAPARRSATQPTWSLPETAGGRQGDRRGCGAARAPRVGGARGTAESIVHGIDRRSIRGPSGRGGKGGRAPSGLAVLGELERILRPPLAGRRPTVAGSVGLAGDLHPQQRVERSRSRGARWRPEGSSRRVAPGPRGWGPAPLRLVSMMKWAPCSRLLMAFP